VSRICQAIGEEFDAWKQRSLTGVELEYLYLDASHFRFHDGARAEPVLVAWGITSDGQPRLLALESISAESHDAVVGFLRGLIARGLRPPLLTITDGAPGLIGAVEQVFPDSLRQRCLIHRARNGREGVRRRPGRGEGRLLGHLRRHHRRCRRGRRR